MQLAAKMSLALAALWFGSAAAAADPVWPAAPYNYVVVDQDLREVLQQFGGNTGLKIALSDKVRGRVHGPLPALPPKQFLDNLAQQFGLEWVYDGAIIAVSAGSEDQTEIIPLHDVPFPKLHAGLAGAGLVDARYELKPVMGGSAALVSGPPRYLSLVHDGLAALPPDRPAVSAAPALAGPAPKKVLVMRGASSSTVEFKR